MIDLILENVGSPACSNHTKKLEDEKKCWRNSADALLERYYLSNGAFGIAKEYTVLAMVVYGEFLQNKLCGTKKKRLNTNIEM